MWRDRDVIIGLILGGSIGYIITKELNGIIVGAIILGAIAGLIRR